jgi:cytochrome d ubiquinol oxidase subunit II
MGTLWFWIVAVMLTCYVVLDGFDLGVGIVYLFVAGSDRERMQSIRSVGPVWDGNEVWLLAAGGTLFFAFPLLYASAFSGFYLPLMIVLWLLILRGVSIELRSHIDDRMWKSFFDAVFFLSSSLLAIFYGAALANVVRGVPLGADDSFFLPLWTNWQPGVNPGILDWYTVLGGVLALAALAMHGALYLAMKTEGELERRAGALAGKLWWAVVALTALSIPATVLARPNSLANYQLHPVAFLAPGGVLASLIIAFVAMRRKSEGTAFLASCGYLLSMMVGAVAGLFPVILPNVAPGGSDMTVARALAGEHTLHVGVIWWSFGMALALFYAFVSYWLFRGKVAQDAENYGH